MSRIFVILLLAVSLVLSALNCAKAAVLEVAPISIELSGGTSSAAITITNHDPTPVFVQVRGFAWAQTGNIDTLTQTDDIALAPPIFSLPSGVPQVVRIVLEQPAGAQERAYRLLIDQIPTQRAHTGVQFALRLSLPLFVEPGDEGFPKVQTHIESVPTGGFALVVDNTGTQRVRLIGLALKTETGTAIKLSSPPNPYILPGAERRWTLDRSASIAPGASLRVTATTDSGPFSTTTTFAP